jgi:hypothetical protein
MTSVRISSSGAAEPRMLRFTDAHIPDSSLGRPRLCDAPIDEVVGLIVEHIRAVRLQVVLTHDGYGQLTGYPDHVRTHQATVLAFHTAGVEHLHPEAGAPWQSKALYAATHPHAGAQRSVTAHASVVLRSWFQTHRGAAYIEPVGVGNGLGAQVRAVWVVGVLRSVHLRFAGRDPNPVGEIGEVAWGSVSGRDRGLQEFECLALEGRGEVSVLGEEPCLLGSLFTDQRDAWPAVLGDDVFEPGSVVGVDPAHLVSVVSLGREAARGLVFFGPAMELGGEVVVHRNSSRCGVKGSGPDNCPRRRCPVGRERVRIRQLRCDRTNVRLTTLSFGPDKGHRQRERDA